ncbi:MAG TPA: TRC40/GET3/ArsA family transport-energizing ATPase [Dehalococcoidia bacterium]
MRIVLYTGKGGVGKTSVSAATGLRCAELGYRTIVLSTDPAHSLADSFDMPLGAEPVRVTDRLWGQELDVFHEMNVHWGTLQEWLRALLAWRGIDEILADEMAVLPGMEELSGLLYLLTHHDSGNYDVVIVDCAPTGETLRLLSFPDVLRWWMDRLFPLERAAARVARPFLSRFTDLPVPSDQVFAAAQDLFQRLERMRDLLDNPDLTSVRLVMNPEKMVIKEAQRTFTYLNLYGYPTDLVICNRMIPEDVTDPFFAAWKESQARWFQEIVAGFSPLPILTGPLMGREVVGLAMLSRFAAALYGDRDPTQVFYRGAVNRVEQADGAFILTLPLPFAAKEDLGLVRVGDELVVKAGNQRRNITLPRTLAGLEPAEARFEGDLLRIRFTRPAS